MTSKAAASAGSPDGPALQLTGVSAGYGTTPVLRDVSLTVPPGGVTAVVGPNGAGKSTLLKVISGLLPVMAGSVEIAGAEVTREPAERRVDRGVCLVPEGRGVYRGLTVRENLVMQARRGQEDAAVGRAVEMFPVLGTRLSQQAGTMSGGEQQMLALSAAVAREPRLILVDEPSLGLAPVVVDVVFEFLAGMRGDDVALLVVDQYVHRVLALADQAHVLLRGALAFSGPAAELAEADAFERYLGEEVVA
ncbi:ABC transporter ATP-binding protein [Frankia sp. EI5c]|uniref:ABC transporter ATP-binding protein n=1 Tax=Frankia sp. EI5c TaxID=683316 RepID=UPI0008261011|nr:ABC transporter ATP-binding protein [Frankia sp. EI5c]